jgi:hypothetical protein
MNDHFLTSNGRIVMWQANLTAMVVPLILLIQRTREATVLPAWVNSVVISDRIPERIDRTKLVE